LREGAPVRELGLELGCSTRTILRIGAEAALVRRRLGQSRLRLSFAERERISRGIAAAESDAAIARALGRHRSTVGREIAAGGGRRLYRALAAERAAQRRGRRPKPSKLAGSGRLRAAVEDGLERCWSPQQTPPGCGSTIPMISRCGSVTRPSIARCMCSRAASCAAS
jgi:hypothetical protein